MSKLTLMCDALDTMFPQCRVQTAVDPTNPEMGNVSVSLGEWIRSADDFPKEIQPIAVNMPMFNKCGKMFLECLCWGATVE